MTMERVMEIFKGQPAIWGVEAAKFKRGYQLFRWESETYYPISKLTRTTDGLVDVLLEMVKTFYEEKFRDAVTRDLSEAHRTKLCEILAELEDSCR